MELFPALLIGGPPHMGKSVLTYSLTHALRERGVPHYVIRAYPDGEGDWANESDQKLVRRIRVKGKGTPRWVDRICRDIAARHLPLIVDVGGRPTPDQERIFDCCTHSILLTGDQTAHATWEAMLARHGLIPLADLRSQLTGQARLAETGLVLRGLITGLERGTTAAGPTFAALVERVARLFAYDPAELRRTHLVLAPAETTVDLDRLARILGGLQLEPPAGQGDDTVPGSIQLDELVSPIGTGGIVVDLVQQAGRAGEGETEAEPGQGRGKSRHGVSGREAKRGGIRAGRRAAANGVAIGDLPGPVCRFRRQSTTLSAAHVAAAFAMPAWSIAPSVSDQ